MGSRREFAQVCLSCESSCCCQSLTIGCKFTVKKKSYKQQRFRHSNTWPDKERISASIIRPKLKNIFSLTSIHLLDLHELPERRPSFVLFVLIHFKVQLCLCAWVVFVLSFRQVWLCLALLLCQPERL